MTLTDLDFWQIVYLLVGALGIGISKSGFPGVSMVHVVMYAWVFGAEKSTGVLLPMLIVGDLCAIHFFGRKANWAQIRRLLPPTLVGVIAGAVFMYYLGDTTEANQATSDPSATEDKLFERVVGGIILVLTAVQLTRMAKPHLFEKIPHQVWFAITLGLLGGVTTMLANAAGPIVALYLLSVSLPKMELIGTSAWLFLVLNCFKVPFSFGLGLITPATLLIGGLFALAIPVGILLGRWLVGRVPQTLFNILLLGFTGFAAVRMLF